MRLPTLRRTRNSEPGRVLGTARLDRRTKRLVGRLRPGDIAVIDHVDLDRVAADSLVAVGVAAVLNAKPSVSGRYPNLGPEVLIAAGIPLLDDLGESVFERIREGDTVRIEGNTVFVGEEPVAHGSLQDAESVGQGDGRRPGGAVGPVGGVRRQHDGLPQAGARPAARRGRACRTSRPRSRAGTA